MEVGRFGSRPGKSSELCSRYGKSWIDLDVDLYRLQYENDIFCVNFNIPLGPS